MITHVQVLLAGWATALAAIIVFAGWREHRRKQRTDFDQVGLIPWPTVQVLAAIGLALCGLLAMGI